MATSWLFQHLMVSEIVSRMLRLDHCKWTCYNFKLKKNYKSKKFDEIGDFTLWKRKMKNILIQQDVGLTIDEVFLAKTKEE